MDSLLRLVGDLSVLHASWEREPFVSTGLGDFDDVFGVDMVEGLLHSGLPVASVRLFLNGEQLPAAGLTQPRERGGRTREPVVDPAAVMARVGAGATLVVEELQTYSPRVAEFAESVTRATGYATYCAAFLTPGATRGVAPHYDLASVFIRQVQGAKRWLVRSPVQRWPSREWSAGMDVGTDEVLDVVLKAGECLYIPRGFVHVGDATDDASVHLSVALRPVTWGAALRRLLASAATGSESLREALPPAFSTQDRAELLREKLAELARCLAAVGEAPQSALAALLPAATPAPDPTRRPGQLARALSRRGEPSHGDG